MSYDRDRVMVSPGGDGKVYVVIDNKKCHIPDNATSNNLWASNRDGIQHITQEQLNEIPTGAELSEGAVLAMATDKPDVFLITGGQKRHIRDMPTFGKYGFNQGSIYTVPKILIDPIPPGVEIT